MLDEKNLVETVTDATKDLFLEFGQLDMKPYIEEWIKRERLFSQLSEACT